MNERIKSLLAKAHLDVMEDLGDIDSNHVAEKFAELIIEECASKVDNILREKKHGGGTMGDEIREHFGVEE